MAIKFQYNKTSLNELNKQLKTRTRALPTLKSKESALRLEVKKAKQRSEGLVEQLEAELKSYEYMARLWNEFEPGLISVTDVKLKSVKIAGVPVPALEEVLFDVKDINLFTKPMWYADGVQILVGGLYRGEPHFGLPAEKDHTESQPLREGANSWLQRSHT